MTFFASSCWLGFAPWAPAGRGRSRFGSLSPFTSSLLFPKYSPRVFCRSVCVRRAPGRVLQLAAITSQYRVGVVVAFWPPSVERELRAAPAKRAAA